MKQGILAFCGSKGSGKTTSYEIFKELYNGKVQEIALAGHLKEVCSEVFNIDMKYFVDPTLKEVELDNFVNLTPDKITEVYTKFGLNDIDFDTLVRPHVNKTCYTPRKLLQYIGTELLHPIDPLIHVKIAMTKKDPEALTIITDLRFVPEFNFFKDSTDFTPVYIKNNRAELAAADDSHPSEREFFKFKDKCSEVIDNNGTMIELRNQINTFVNKLSKTELQDATI